MLESDYDYYCFEDEILIKKEDAPPVPIFHENESIVKMLLLVDEHSSIIRTIDGSSWVQKRVGGPLRPYKMFNELLLTDQRILLLKNGLLESEIYLGNVCQAVSGIIEKPLPVTTLMIDQLDGESTLFLFNDGSEAEEWTHAINRTTHQTDSQSLAQKD